MQILIKDPADRKTISDRIPRLIEYWNKTAKHWENYSEEFNEKNYKIGTFTPSEDCPKYRQSALDKAEKLRLMKYFMDGYFEDDLLLDLEDLELLEEEVQGN